MTTKIDYLVKLNGDWLDAIELVNGESPPEPIDLTGSSFRSHIRTSTDSLTVVLDASTANGMHLIVDSSCAWNVSRETLVEKFKPGKYVYDTVWTDADGVDTPVAEGEIIAELGVTRP